MRSVAEEMALDHFIMLKNNLGLLGVQKARWDKGDFEHSCRSKDNIKTDLTLGIS
jgi:hypothetical protein